MELIIAKNDIRLQGLRFGGKLVDAGLQLNMQLVEYLAARDVFTVEQLLMYTIDPPEEFLNHFRWTNIQCTIARRTLFKFTQNRLPLVFVKRYKRTMRSRNSPATRAARQANLALARNAPNPTKFNSETGKIFGSLGGQRSAEDKAHMAEIGRKGGQMTHLRNSKEHMKAIASRGGHSAAKKRQMAKLRKLGSL